MQVKSSRLRGELLQIRCGDALLGSRSQESSLRNDALFGFVKPVSMAIRTGDNPRCHDGLASFAHLVVFRGFHDFPGTSRPVLKVVRGFHNGRWGLLDFIARHQESAAGRFPKKKFRG